MSSSGVPTCAPPVRELDESWRVGCRDDEPAIHEWSGGARLLSYVGREAFARDARQPGFTREPG